MTNTNEALYESSLNRCKHFTGLANKVCKAGVEYKSVLDTSTAPARMPCLKSNDCSSVCAMVSYMTPEEALARVQAIEKRGPQMGFMCRREVKR